MSLINIGAETSKAAIEIYTPVIVGLGAVVLGFFANGLLEWLRSYINRRASRSDLRKGLYFDIAATKGAVAGAIKTLESANGDAVIFLREPSLLTSVEPKELGLLSEEEILSLSTLISLYETHLALRQDDSKSGGKSFTIRIFDQNRQTFIAILKGTLTNFDDAMSKLRSRF